MTLDAGRVPVDSRRVLLLSNCPPDENLGSGHAVALVLAELGALGWQVDLIVPRSIGLFKKKRGSRYLAPFVAAFQGLRQVRRRRYGLIVCVGGEWGFFAWLRKLLRGPREVCIQYSNGVESHATRCMTTAEEVDDVGGRRWFQRGDLSGIYDLAFTSVDHIVVLSEFDAAYLRKELGIEAHRITVLNDPLPDYFLGRPLAPSRPGKVGYCGTWIPRKNTSLILRDVQRFLKDYPGWEFEAVGKGTEDLSDVTTAAGSVRARMKGRGAIPKVQLPDWYRECAVLIVPSFYESFGLVAAEGMACGCAVVAAPKVAFTSELQDRAEVYLLRDTGPPHLYNALCELATNETLRQSIAAGGYKYVQSLTGAAWRKQFRTLSDRLGVLGASGG